MSEHMTPEQLQHLIAEVGEQVIHDWIHSKYEIALATDIGDSEQSIKALERMRYLHYSEPHIPAFRIANRVRDRLVVIAAEQALLAGGDPE
jgi:hypothetical protein